MKKLNWSTVITSLVTLGIIAFIGGVIDFQTIKADVVDLQESEKASHKTLKAIGFIVCTYAIKDEMKDAKETCKAVLGN